MEPGFTHHFTYVLTYRKVPKDYFLFQYNVIANIWISLHHWRSAKLAIWSFQIKFKPHLKPKPRSSHPWQSPWNKVWETVMNFCFKTDICTMFINLRLLKVVLCMKKVDELFLVEVYHVKERPKVLQIDKKWFSMDFEHRLFSRTFLLTSLVNMQIYP